MQHLRTFGAFGGGHGTGQREGGCVGAFGISEHVQVGNVQFVQEVVRVQKVRFGLARKAHNHIHADAAAGHQRFYPSHALRVQLAHVAAAHEPQYLVAARLQRNVEVRRKSL